MSDEKQSVKNPLESDIEAFLETGIATPTFYERYKKYHDVLLNANGFGRPTKYFPEYCYALIEYMELGYTYEAIAGLLNVGLKTLYQWEQAFPEFAQAKEIGHAKARFTLEGMGLKGMSGQIEGFVTTVWVFHMKNRFGWRDQPEEANSSVQDGYESKIKLAIEMMRKRKADQFSLTHTIDVVNSNVGTAPEPAIRTKPYKKRTTKQKLNEDEMFEGVRKEKKK